MSCCRNKRLGNYYAHSLNNSCCNQSNNSCCNQSNNSCCNQSNNGCCNQSNNDCCNNYSNNNCGCNNNTADLTGVSCPFHNNNDCECEDSLREAAKRLTNQRVIIHTDGCKMCVVIMSVGCTFIKTVNPCTHKIIYFNLNRIDNIEDVLPRCY